MKSKISSAILLCLIAVSCAWGEARTFVEYPTLGECTGDSVRIRSNPSTNSEIIGKLDKYDKIVVLGRIKAQNGVWYQERAKHTFPGNISCQRTGRNFNAVKVQNS